MVTIKTIVIFQIIIVFLSSIIFFLVSSDSYLAAISAFIGGAIGFIPSAWFGWRLQMLTAKMGMVLKSTNSVSAAPTFRQNSMVWIVMQLAKMVISLSLFFLVATLFKRVQWAPLLLTYFFSLKIYWLAFLWPLSKQLKTKL